MCNTGRRGRSLPLNGCPKAARFVARRRRCRTASRPSSYGAAVRSGFRPRIAIAMARAFCTGRITAWIAGAWLAGSSRLRRAWNPGSRSGWPVAGNPTTAASRAHGRSKCATCPCPRARRACEGASCTAGSQDGLGRQRKTPRTRRSTGRGWRPISVLRTPRADALSNVSSCSCR